VKGKPTYLRQSVTAVMIALVALLVMGRNHASGAQPALESPEVAFKPRVQTVSLHAADGVTPEKQSEMLACARLGQAALRLRFTVHTTDYLRGLLSGGALAERFIVDKTACLN
jgi:hypothetical protein